MNIVFTDQRSALHFFVFIIIAVWITVFILNKAEEAVAEIQKLSELPTMQIRRNLERKDIIYLGNQKYEGWDEKQMRQNCYAAGGEFNPCGSACENPHEMCSQICAPRCEFNKGL